MSDHSSKSELESDEEFNYEEKLAELEKRNKFKKIGDFEKIVSYLENHPNHNFRSFITSLLNFTTIEILILNY